MKMENQEIYSNDFQTIKNILLNIFPYQNLMVLFDTTVASSSD